jgi:AcrR family transcriptional regulator
MKSLRPKVDDDSLTESKGIRTREKILFEAGELFNKLGFVATTTRDIASAVGIKQPSLYFHFKSKDEIASALFDLSLTRPLELTKFLLSTRQSATIKLYAYISFDTQWLVGLPVNLTGIYQDNVVARPEFKKWQKLDRELQKNIQIMLDTGMKKGEFRKLDPVLAQQMISGINLKTIRRVGKHFRSLDNLHEEIAEFVLRGLLLKPVNFSEIRKSSRELLSKMSEKT